MRASVTIMLIGAAIASAGCMVRPLDRRYAGPAPLTDEVLAPFRYERRDMTWSTETIGRERGYTIRRITLEPVVSLVDSGPIVIDYYDLDGHEPTPVIMVLPILGGGNQVAKFFAAYFARQDLAVCIVHRQEKHKQADKLELFNPIFRQIVLDHMQAIDWLETQPDIDQDRIGLFGVSAGAIKGSLVYALDKRVKAAVLALVGGDVPHILSYSDQKGIVKRRNKILAAHKIDQAELYDTLKKEFRHDPLRYAQHMDARRALLVLAAFDRTVQYENGLRLRAAMGNPRTIIIPTGHLTAVLYVFQMQQWAMGHFRREFGLPDEEWPLP